MRGHEGTRGKRRGAKHRFYSNPYPSKSGCKISPSPLFYRPLPSLSLLITGAQCKVLTQEMAADIAPLATSQVERSVIRLGLPSKGRMAAVTVVADMAPSATSQVERSVVRLGLPSKGRIADHQTTQSKTVHG